MRLLILCLIVAASELSLATDGQDTLEDASDVTWAHAVNSRQSLEKELSGNVMFLEADISLGHVVGKDEERAIPIMAHPPSNTSGISFEDWLGTVIGSKKGKGIKLDFKVIEVVEPSLKTLDLVRNKLTFPLWLNADILPGPVNAPRLPVDAAQFLSLCRRYFPNATLSVGWTTFWDPRVPPDAMRYDWTTVRQMADTIHCNSVAQPVSFPVRAAFIGQSVSQLSWLVTAVPDSSLTVWNTPFDPADFDALLRLRATLPRSLVYYDLLHPTKAFWTEKKTVELKPASPDSEVKVHVVRSGSLRQEDGCPPQSYTTPKSVMFRSKDHFAAVLSPVRPFNGEALKITGGIELFGSLHEGGNVTFFLADSQALPSGKLISDGVSQDDSDFWQILDGLSPYRLPVNTTSKCHFFQLDSGADPPLTLTDCDTRLSMKVMSTPASRPKPPTEIIPDDRAIFGFTVSGPLEGVVFDIQVGRPGGEGGSDGTALSRASVLLTTLCILLVWGCMW